MSGGYDLTVVLHNLTTGKVIKKWQINYEFISCFFRVDKVVAVGVSNKVFFIDFRTKRIINGKKFKVNGSYVLCMQS